MMIEGILKQTVRDVALGPYWDRIAEQQIAVIQSHREEIRDVIANAMHPLIADPTAGDYHDHNELAKADRVFSALFGSHSAAMTDEEAE